MKPHAIIITYHTYEEVAPQLEKLQQYSADSAEYYETEEEYAEGEYYEEIYKEEEEEWDIQEVEITTTEQPEN